MNKLCMILILLFVSAGILSAKDYIVTSPDGKIKVTVSVDKEINWSIGLAGEELLKASKIAMDIKDSKIALGVNPAVRKVSNKTVDSTIEAVVPTKSKFIRDHYNEMSLICKGDYTLTFRVYDNGAAYRFETNMKSDIFVENETVEFNLGGDYKTYWPKETSSDFITHCEGDFEYLSVSQIGKQKYAYLPIYLASDKGTKMVIMDPDLFDYPNLFLFGSEGTKLRGEFPPVILEKEIKEGSDRNEKIIKNADYLAKTKGKRTFPWRLMIINHDDRSLLENNLVYQLSSPTAVPSNTDWIKPGKISWDWWSTLNVYDVDFVAGVNTETYKYFIDFASKFGLEYILLDEGWSAGTWNIKEPNKSIDIEELVRYGKSKNVGLVLWALWNPLEKDIEGILDVYKAWGIKGIKVDFMQRNDQDMVNFYENVGKAAFDRQILVDFHGSYKPSGLHRKYPNVMTFEGVYGLEHNKSSHDITPNHDLILPFTRMVAGPMDYTPGATKNATAEGFCMDFIHPSSHGTRAHQGALYVIFESPLQMLADSPSNYYNTPSFAGFIAQMPTVWHETKALEAEAGKYVVMARKNGDKWYIGALTNWDARSLDIKLDFLDGKKYKAQILKDGVNANSYPADFKIVNAEISKGQNLKIDMAKGGGWAAILTPTD